MARPAKSVHITSKHLTKNEKLRRSLAEEQIQTNVPPSPPDYLSGAQVQIFGTICTQLQESKILCDIDNYVLATFAIAVDRLQTLEQLINADADRMMDKSVMQAKDRYTKDFFRCCTELCLSPQSRAKMALANANAEKDKANPLHKLFEGLDESEL